MSRFKFWSGALALIIAMTLATTASDGMAQSASPTAGSVAPTTPLDSLRADHVFIGVDDFDRSLAWYVEKLGFKVEKQWTVEGLPGLRLAYLIGYGFRIELVGGRRGQRLPVPQKFGEHFALRGLQHLAFWSEDVDAVAAELRHRGVPIFVQPTDYPDGAARRVFFIKDAEGNVIEFAGPLRGR